MKIKLPFGDGFIEIDVTGSITLSPELISDDPQYKAALDGITSLLLAMVCENVPVTTAAFVRALETTADYINNIYGDA